MWLVSTVENSSSEWESRLSSCQSPLYLRRLALEFFIWNCVLLLGPTVGCLFPTDNVLIFQFFSGFCACAISVRRGIACHYFWLISQKQFITCFLGWMDVVRIMNSFPLWCSRYLKFIFCSFLTLLFGLIGLDLDNFCLVALIGSICSTLIQAVSCMPNKNAYEIKFKFCTWCLFLGCFSRPIKYFIYHVVLSGHGGSLSQPYWLSVNSNFEWMWNIELGRVFLFSWCEFCFKVSFIVI
jgi:hypothetical protein